MKAGRKSQPFQANADQNPTYASNRIFPYISMGAVANRPEKNAVAPKQSKSIKSEKSGSKKPESE